MSLKELTKDKHSEAEHTMFMQSVIRRSLPEAVWADYVFQRFIIYSSLEAVARDAGLTTDLPGMERAIKLFQDAMERCGGDFPGIRPETVEYSRYLLGLTDSPEKILAHLYTLHMGDLHGGQEIKKIIPGPHRSLGFDDLDGLKTKIRAKLNDSMAEESKVAFDWIIRLLNIYNDQVGIQQPL